MKCTELAVDAKANEEDAARAISRLRAMARAGKIAEKALRNIETQGYHSGRVLVLQKSRWYSRLEVEELHLERARTPLRNEAPDFLDLSVSLVPSPSDKYEVKIEGTGMTMKDRHTFEHVTVSVSIGRVNFNKNNVTFSGKDGTFPLYTTFNTKKSRDALVNFARSIVLNNYDMFLVYGEAGQKKNYDSDNQYFNSMRDFVIKWLHEEGHAERLLHDLRKLCQVQSVMAA